MSGESVKGKQSVKETGHGKSASDKSIVGAFSFGDFTMVIASDPSIRQSCPVSRITR